MFKLIKSWFGKNTVTYVDYVHNYFGKFTCSNGGEYFGKRYSMRRYSNGEWVAMFDGVEVYGRCKSPVYDSFVKENEWVPLITE